MLLRKLLQWANIVGPEDTTTDFPIQNVSYLGKTAPAYVLFPYGMHAHIPTGFLGLKFAINGNAESRVLIPCSPKERPQLAAGEVAFFHPLIPGMIITLQNDGTLSIESPTLVKVDAPEAEFTGNVTILGNLDVQGSTTMTGSVTSNGVNISDTHQHSGVQTGGGNTGTPI